MYAMTDTKKETPLYLRVLLVFYFVLEFFEPYINAAFGSYTKFYLILLIFVLLNYHGFRIIYNKTAIYFVYWFLYKCLTIIWCRNNYIYQLHFFTNFTAVILLYLLTIQPMSKKTIENITAALWIGSGLIGVLSLISNEPYLGVSNRIVLKLFNVSVDPNNDAAFLAVGIAVSLYYLINPKIKKVIKAYSIISILVNTYALFMTGSRGGLLTEVGIFAVLAFFYIQKGKHKIMFCVGLLGMIALIDHLSHKYLPLDVYYRLFETATYEGGSERTEIWSNAFTLINSDPIYYLFGTGWGSYYGYNGYYVVMHNTYLSILCDTGIIGIMLFFFPIIKAVRKLYIDKNALPILLLTAGFIPAFFLEAINKRFFWNAIIFILLCYKIDSVEEEKNETTI